MTQSAFFLRTLIVIAVSLGGQAVFAQPANIVAVKFNGIPELNFMSPQGSQQIQIIAIHPGPSGSHAVAGNYVANSRVQMFFCENISLGSSATGPWVPNANALPIDAASALGYPPNAIPSLEVAGLHAALVPETSNFAYYVCGWAGTGEGFVVRGDISLGSFAIISRLKLTADPTTLPGYNQVFVEDVISDATNPDLVHVLGKVTQTGGASPLPFHGDFALSAGGTFAGTVTDAHVIVTRLPNVSPSAFLKTIGKDKNRIVGTAGDKVGFFKNLTDPLGMENAISFVFGGPGVSAMTNAGAVYQIAPPHPIGSPFETVYVGYDTTINPRYALLIQSNLRDGVSFSKINFGSNRPQFFDLDVTQNAGSASYADIVGHAFTPGSNTVYRPIYVRRTLR